MKNRKENGYPQVLLLGNGINQLNGGVSWYDFLHTLATKKEIKDGEILVEDLRCPEPLKAILVTNDHVDVALKEYWKKYQPGITGDISLLLKILSIGFDDILTTNYTYELEQAALYPGKISKPKIKAMMRHTDGSKKAEGKYLLHTYNEAVTAERINRIWHIDGEARKPDSTNLGHYYYGNLLCKIKEELSGRRYDKDRECKSWVDSFVLGDVYVLGFGFGFSEIDMWWLLNRKAREKEYTGKVYFYAAEPVGFSEKHELLRMLKNTYNGESVVEIVCCGHKEKTVIENGREKTVLDGSYETFYNDAISDIVDRMNRRK